MDFKAILNFEECVYLLTKSGYFKRNQILVLDTYKFVQKKRDGLHYERNGYALSLALWSLKGLLWGAPILVSTITYFINTIFGPETLCDLRLECQK